MKTMETETELISQCCVCKRIADATGGWIDPPTDINEENISHGYCETCYEDFVKSFKQDSDEKYI